MKGTSIRIARLAIMTDNAFELLFLICDSSVWSRVGFWLYPKCIVLAILPDRILMVSSADCILALRNYSIVVLVLVRVRKIATLQNTFHVSPTYYHNLSDERNPQATQIFLTG